MLTKDAGRLWIIVGVVVVLLGLALGAHQAYDLLTGSEWTVGARRIVVIGLSTAIVPCALGLILTAIGHLARTWGGR